MQPQPRGNVAHGLRLEIQAIYKQIPEPSCRGTQCSRSALSFWPPGVRTRRSALLVVGAESGEGDFGRMPKKQTARRMQDMARARERTK